MRIGASKWSLPAVLLALALATPAAAQRPVELGIDGSIARTSFDGFGVTSFEIPITRVRAGFGLSESLALEPSIGLIYLNSDGESLTTFALGVGLFHHFKTDRTVTRPYLGVTSGLSFVDVSDFDSETDFALGAEGGLKMPMSDRLDFRLGAFLERAFDAEATSFGLRFGLSFWTR